MRDHARNRLLLFLFGGQADSKSRLGVLRLTREAVVSTLYHTLAITTKNVLWGTSLKVR